MLGLRHLPLKYRLPLIHGTLNALGQWRSRNWPKATAEDGLGSGDFVVSGFLNEGFGIGRAGCLSLQAFRAAGYDIIAHDLRPAFKRISLQNAVLPGEGGVWFIHANAPEVLVALLAHDPKSWGNRYRIAYWAWETPKAPVTWVTMADYLHEIWVPSRFVCNALIKTFEAAGRADLIARLRVMPHPVVLPPAGRHDGARQKFGLDAAVCEVLCLFDTKSSAARKNPWGVVEVWQRAFPQATDQARLTLKVSDLSSDPVTRQKLLALAAARSDICLMHDRLSDRDMELFISAFDVLISLHRAEGFGLTLAEAMASGVAVIATGWSGNCDFMTPDNAKLVPASLVPVYDPEGNYAGLEGDPEQIWAEPELWVATRALRELAAEPSRRNALVHAALPAIRALSDSWQTAALVGLPFNRWL